MADNGFDSLFEDDDNISEDDDLFSGDESTETSDDSDDDLEFEDASEFLNNGAGSQDVEEEPEDDKTTKKKIALFSIGLGIVVLIIGAIVANIALKSREKRLNEENSSYTESYENNKEESKQSKQEAKKETKSVQKSQDNVVSNNSAGSINDAWIEVDLSEPISFQATISSDFTVTDIKHYAKIVNSLNDRSLKTIVTGSISGLTGTYELEVPTDKAQNLKIGSVFAVEYNMSDKGSYKIIGGVHYK